MHTVYGVAERITVLDVQKARLRVLFALRLVISERTRMSVKFNRSEICGMHKSRR